MSHDEKSLPTTVRRGPALWAAALGWLAVTLAAPPPASAEVQIGVYGGMNFNFSSQVSLHKGAIADDRTVDWDGKSFEMPPYWGVKGTYWFQPGAGWGLGIDFTHAKAYADVNFAADPVYNHLEFTDGNNLLMLNVMYRFAPWMDGKLYPYVGIGGGVAIPHVEVRLKAFPGQDTWEYQLAGGAAQALVGLDYRLSDSWSIFSEAKLSYSHLDTDLTGSGQLKTYLWQPQIMLGLSYRLN